MQIEDKHTKRNSVSLVIIEIQIKTITYTLEWLELKQNRTEQVLAGYRASGNGHVVGRNTKWYCHFGQQLEMFL